MAMFYAGWYLIMCYSTSMSTLITRALVTAFALLLLANFWSGITITGLVPALIAGAVIGILNTFVRPILVVLTFPITLLTLGLFIFVINASLVYLAARFVDGFSVSSFGAALLGSIFISIVSAIANRFIS